MGISAMTIGQDILADVRAALDSVAALDLHKTPVDVDWDGQAVTLEGEVVSIVAKKMEPSSP
jgi:hypothetical protein